MVHPLDDIDRRIISELEADARLSGRALADRVSISRANAYARLDRLIADGVITGFTAVVDPARVGLMTSAYVTLSVRHPMSIVTIIARKGQSAALGEALKAAYKCPLPGVGQSTGKGAIAFHWCGADQYYAIAEGRAEGELYRDLKVRLQGLASCSDQSHGLACVSRSPTYPPSWLNR